MDKTRGWRLVMAALVALGAACGSPTNVDHPPSDNKRPDEPPPSEGMIVPATSDSVTIDGV